MYKKNKILAVIGARAGSKGLKNKNILNFAGKPLIQWSIESSLRSRYIDRTLVSTDGGAIARIAAKAGADVPFMRPAALATDRALINDVLRHTLRWLKDHEGTVYDYIVLLQPTSPLRTTRHIDRAIEHYFRRRKTAGDTLVSVVEAPAKTGWLMGRDAKGYIDFCFDIEGQKQRRQNIPSYYLPNGLIYLAPVAAVDREGFYSSKTLPFVMSDDVSIDIDGKDDFNRALKMFRLTRR